MALPAPCCLPVACQTDDAKRPQFRITSDEKFDAAAVPPYSGNHEAIYGYIDRHVPEHVAHLQRWIQQPSVSAQDYGLQEMAVMLRDDLRTLGFKEAELVPTGGHPGVWDITMQMPRKG